MPLNKGSRLALIFLAVAGLLLGSVGVTYWAGLAAANSSRKLTAQRMVIGHLDQFLSSVKDAETGQRGYLLTGRESYLKPYRKAVLAIHAELESLADLASRAEIPADTASRIDVLTKQKLAELEQTVEQRRERGLQAALSTVASDRGKQIMDDIRTQVGDIRTKEEELFQREALAAQWAAQIQTGVFLATSLVNLVFLAWAYRRIAEEISRRDLAIAETGRQKDLLATTLASIGDGVIVTDTDARVTFMNRMAAELTGWSAEQADRIAVTDVFKIINEETRAAVENPVARVLRTGAIAGLANHTLLVRKDGQELNIDDSGAPICGSDGTMHGAVLVFRDISERHEAEDSLRRSEERFRLLFQQAAVGIKRLDGDGRMLEVNDRQCEILGYSRDELLQLCLSDITHPDDLAQEKVEIARLLAREIPYYSIEKRCLRKNGDVILVRATSSLPSRNLKEAPWWISVVEDITQRKQAEEALRQMSDDLARSNQDLEQFAYVASHDLQEPLRMVAGYLQLLSERYRGRLDEKADKFIAYAVDGAERMSGLIRDLLAYSRVNSGGGDFRMTSVEEALQAALKNLAASIQESGAAIRHNPLPLVRADGIQLRRLFQNLIGNAIKFRSPERTAEIQITAQKDRQYWLFTVEDNGIGFDEKYHDKMFLIFQRLQSRGKYPGTGIGLAICKRIVERHGGNIWANSQAGRGSAFHFTIPIKAAL
jgi:PAS domain S-box-containing protein